jgi:hypothetical protein
MLSVTIKAVVLNVVAPSQHVNSTGHREIINLPLVKQEGTRRLGQTRPRLKPFRKSTIIYRPVKTKFLASPNLIMSNNSSYLMGDKEIQKGPISAL